jgi:hypothetical protein
MPCVTFPLNISSIPILEIGIAAPNPAVKSRARNSSIFWIKAAVDTGCSHTAIPASVASKAGLRVRGKTMVRSSTDFVPADVYHGDLFIKCLHLGKPWEFRFENCDLVALPTTDPDYEALLGMDILSKGSYHINGLTKQAIFCW